MVNPELMEEIERRLYVDDLSNGKETTNQALEIKMTATAIFGEATFKQHKWQSNNQNLKRLIARRGRPEKTYSDNGKTFVRAEKWLKQVMRDERIIGLVKTALNKTIGCGMLTWTELCEVVLDVEIALNNRPLCYVEDDIQLPVLTPNSLLVPRLNQPQELKPHHLREFDQHRRAKYLRRCKQGLWTRWTTEYLRRLRERHWMKHKGQTTPLAKGEVVIIKDEERNRNKWTIGFVEDLISGRDGIV
nr:uncharacterized protein LOC131800242 [Pocillopora verrucosa]